MATDHIFQEVLEVTKANDSGTVEILQETLEFAKALNNTDVRMFQEVLEVVKGWNAPTLACPISGISATVGEPYTAMLLVSGGKPPYTFTIIA